MGTLLSPQNLAALTRAIMKALRSDDPGIALTAVTQIFVSPNAQGHLSPIVARVIQRTISECSGKINAMMDKIQIAKQKNPRAKLPLHGSTISGRIERRSVQETLDLVNEILWVVDAVITQIRPAGPELAALDEIEIPIYGEGGKEPPENDYRRYAIGAGKRKNEGTPVHRYMVGTIAVQNCIAKWPISIGLYSKRDLVTGKLNPGAKCPKVHEVVENFLDQLDRRSNKPKWIFMDRWFESIASRKSLLARREKWRADGHGTEVLVPAKRNGHSGELILSDTGRRGKQREVLGPISTRMAIEHGDQLAWTPMAQNKSWKFTAFGPNEPYGPPVEKGWNLVVVNAPKGTEIGNNDAVERHVNGTRSFANWTTANLTASTAYEIIRRYNHRNYVESALRMWGDHSGITASPRMDLRVLWFGLGMIMQALWAGFRIAHGIRRGRFQQGDYSFEHFMASSQPNTMAALLMDLQGKPPP